MDAFRYAMGAEIITSTMAFFATDSTTMLPFAQARVSPRPVIHVQRCHYCGRKQKPDDAICPGCGGVQ